MSRRDKVWMLKKEQLFLSSLNGLWTQLRLGSQWFDGPVVQWIEQVFPKHQIQVRFLARPQLILFAAKLCQSWRDHWTFKTLVYQGFLFLPYFIIGWIFVKCVADRKFKIVKAYIYHLLQKYYQKLSYNHSQLTMHKFDFEQRNLNYVQQI